MLLEGYLEILMITIWLWVNTLVGEQIAGILHPCGLVLQLGLIYLQLFGDDFFW